MLESGVVARIPFVAGATVVDCGTGRSARPVVQCGTSGPRMIGRSRAPLGDWTPVGGS